MKDSTLDQYQAALRELWVLRLRIRFRPERPLRPPFPGALLRGALGNALRYMVCGRSSSDDPCPPDRQCAYCALFETRSADAAIWTAGQNRAPHPFAWIVPWQDWDGYAADLVLFGRASELWGPVLAALVRAARRGLGPDRVPTEVASVSCLDARWNEVARVAAERTEGEFGPYSAHDAIAYRVESCRGRSIVFRALSPVRLKVRGKWADRLEPRTVAVAAARRAAALVYHHGGGDSLGPPRDVLDRLGHEEPAATPSWVWQEATRYSSRQARRHKLGGVTGEAVYREMNEAGLYLVSTAAELGLGKAVSFGLGRLEVAPEGMGE